MKIQMILNGMSNHSIFSIINIQTIQNFPPMTVSKFSDYLKNSKNGHGKFSESSDFSVIGGLPDFTMRLVYSIYQ